MLEFSFVVRILFSFEIVVSMAGRFICSGGKVFGPEINLRVGPSSENHLAREKQPVKFPVSIEEKQSFFIGTCNLYFFPG